MLISKKRREASSGQARKCLEDISHAVVRRKERQILEGHLMAGHGHICIAIPPKYPAASVMGFLKEKSAMAVARDLCDRESNFTGEHLWERDMRYPLLDLS